MYLHKSKIYLKKKSIAEKNCNANYREMNFEVWTATMDERSKRVQINEFIKLIKEKLRDYIELSTRNIVEIIFCNSKKPNRRIDWKL